MKKLLLTLLLLIPLLTQAQISVDRIDSLNFIARQPNGTADSVRWFDLGGKYAYVYLVVQDTGATFTDSIKCYSFSKRTTTDSVATPILMRSLTTYTDGISSNTANANTKYLLLDAFIDKLYIVMSNAISTSGRRTKLLLMGVNRK